jgi:hypothetical protein
VQAAVFGACTALFVNAQADVVAGSLPLAALLEMAVAVPTSAAFFIALRARLRVVAEGPQVAVLAIVPIVLLAPPVLAGLPALPARRPRDRPSADGGGRKEDQSPSA